MSAMMKNSIAEALKGSVERVTFHNPENGFCVLRIKVKGHRDLVTVVGKAIAIAAGEYIECQGMWINDRQHGLQFQAQTLSTVLPSTLEGIEKYLGSGMVKNIGRHFAKKLITAFGEAVFDVIETEPERLLELEGIGRKRLDSVIASWAEQKVIRRIMVFLQSHGVGTARAVRIYKTYGENAIALVTENPYRLALDIYGIGFKTADALAEQLGIARDSLIRSQAGVRHVLQELCNAGHCAVEANELIETSATLLEIPVDTIRTAIDQEIMEERLVQGIIADKICFYPAALYTAETRSAEYLKRLVAGKPPWRIPENFASAITTVEKTTGLTLATSQRQALQTLLQKKVSIITGGPGVGKTTLVNSLLTLLKKDKLKITLCAPTGRAAKRLTETTGLPAKTIHRLLAFSPQTFAFQYNAYQPLPVDVLIVDEASMLDILLLHHLLKAIPLHAALILVGDVDQLPSVGSGAVLADCIRSGVITTVHLTEIFRQAASSRIIVNAHRVNQGQLPLPNSDKDSDFFTLYASTPEVIQDQLVELVTQRLPRHYDCHPVKDIQVLTPMNRGSLGSYGLNVLLQQRLNGKAEPKITRFGTTYASGDKVIQTVNNYNKDVFNGDMGFIESIDTEQSEVTIRFDEALKIYAFHELDEIRLAYAISIHKSQGSEFPIVVLPLAMQHYRLLARNLLYTGMTRGRQCVILLGQKKAISMAVRNNKEAQRMTKLAQRLRESL